jgi:hypothetical protein
VPFSFFLLSSRCHLYKIEKVRRQSQRTEKRKLQPSPNKLGYNYPIDIKTPCSQNIQLVWQLYFIMLEGKSKEKK